VTRFPLRARLALVALALLVLPWAGWLYVREMERFLVAAQEEALAATARAVATALHERPKLLTYRARSESDLREEAERELKRLTGGVVENEADARDGAGDGEIAAILKGLERASSRIWVVSRDYRVLALAGSLKRADAPEASLAQRALGWLLAPPTEDFDDAIAEDAVAAGREVAAALQGAASTRTRLTCDVTVASSTTSSASRISWSRLLTWPGWRASECTIQNSVSVSSTRPPFQAALKRFRSSSRSPRTMRSSTGLASASASTRRNSAPMRAIRCGRLTPFVR